MERLTNRGHVSVFLMRCVVALCVTMLWENPADAGTQGTAGPAPVTVTAQTEDGVTIYGEAYYGDLDDTAPLILLFHQGGSNGRGEYEPIARWLNRAGFRAIAWDQRAGGDFYGCENRTVTARGSEESGFCEAYRDLKAALAYVIQKDLAERIIAWGSSYSGSLVFRLAAEEPDKVKGVIAFSPASGGPVVPCRARIWASQVKAPATVFRPASEMARQSSQDQWQILEAAGVSFHVVENGIHGSSMLLDERTGYDMRPARETVINWLESLKNIQ